MPAAILAVHLPFLHHCDSSRILSRPCGVAHTTMFRLFRDEVIAMKRTVVVSSILASLLLILPILTHADPVVTQDLAFIDNRPADDPFGRTGLNLNLTIKATDAGGSSALPNGSVTATSSNSAFPFGQPISVPLNAVYPIINGAEFTRNNIRITPSQFPDVTGNYTFTVTNTSSQSVTSTSHNLDKPEVISLPTNLAFSDQSTTPTFTFTDPNPTSMGDLVLNRKYQVEILTYDPPKTLLISSGILTSPSYTVPVNTLTPGVNYIFRAISWDFDPADYSGAPLHSNGENRAIAYATFPPVPIFSCVGFESPMDSGPVKVKKNRVLPLKANLVNGDGNTIIGTDIFSPPVLHVDWVSTGGSTAIDVTEEALPAGQGTSGNQFVFTSDGIWQFNLMTKNYSAPGTYTISMITGDSLEYGINPYCTATFVVE